ncbi:MAG: tRNA pseudouridine(55) synthase TruB [Flavobacteriales bacterium]|nr:tRNA pseudouridine(55) synthase TruB [Flavobacteriales bacterium]
MQLDMERGDLLLVDKPVGWTSFDVVNKLRGALRSVLGRRIKVGHAGTLDPLASGLLVIGFGARTKDLPLLTGQDKVYTGTLRLGQTTPSYDAESPVQDEKPWEHVGLADIEAVLGQFRGELMQRPPSFSAKRFEGERAYFLARDGAKVDLPPVPVRIDRLLITGMEGPHVHFEVACSKGTYIRSLAHDLGQALGTGAYLSALRRHRSGELDLAHARTPQQWSIWFDEWAKAHPRS